MKLFKTKIKTPNSLAQRVFNAFSGILNYVFFLVFLLQRILLVVGRHARHNL